MNQEKLKTYAENTWCPGCGNFAILNAIKMALGELNAEGIPLENIVLVSGIGCHGKIVDYLNVNSFYSLHGRAVQAAEGIKLSNPNLKVIVFAGDGDAYGEGIEHLIFSAKRNIDITMIIHNNRVYGLTTGQYTPTSPLGFKGRSTPKGTDELPLNPLELMLVSGASFLARSTSRHLELLKDVFKKAILHKGFSLVDVLQVCFTYYNMYDYYGKRAYELKGHDPKDFTQALTKIREWDYNSDHPIALGLFYQKEAPTFETKFLENKEKIIDPDAKIKEFLKNSI